MYSENKSDKIKRGKDLQRGLIMAKTIHIILDSTANVPQQMLKEYANLHVVPLKVIRGSQVWLDGELTNEQLFQQMKDSNFQVRTSQPSPGDFMAVMEPLSANGADIIVITMSGGLSGTVQSAEIAARMLGKNVFVIDSGTTAIGMVKMAQTALDLADDQVPAAEIADYLRLLSKATHTMFVPGSLEYLHRGGRIGGAAALFGGILQIRPILQLVDGRVAVLDKIRTRARAITRLLEELKKYDDLEYVGVVQIEALEEAQQLCAKIAECCPGLALSVTDGGTVLATHLGPGLIGFVFQQRIVSA